jgi:hypothetical protein
VLLNPSPDFGVTIACACHPSAPDNHECPARTYDPTQGFSWEDEARCVVSTS